MCTKKTLKGSSIDGLLFMSAAFKKRMKLANGDAGALLESIGKKEEPKEEKPKKNEPIKPRGPAAALTEDQMVSFLHACKERLAPFYRLLVSIMFVTAGRVRSEILRRSSKKKKFHLCLLRFEFGAYRKMLLKNEYLVAKIGLDTEENEPSKVCRFSVKTTEFYCII